MNTHDNWVESHTGSLHLNWYLNNKIIGNMTKETKLHMNERSRIVHPNFQTSNKAAITLSSFWL